MKRGEDLRINGWAEMFPNQMETKKILNEALGGDGNRHF